MSFRKRFVRPNLVGAKRKSGVDSETSTPNKDDNQNDRSVSKCEQLENLENLEDKSIVKRNDNTTIPPHENKVILTGHSTDEDNCNSPVTLTSKKLSKRLKVTPKLLGRNANISSTCTETKNPPDENDFIESLTKSKEQTTLDKVVVKVKNIEQSSAKNVVETDNGMNNDRAEIIDDSVCLQNNFSLDDANHETTLQETSLEEQKKSCKKLQKRLKVLPKLGKSSLNRTNKKVVAHECKIIEKHSNSIIIDQLSDGMTNTKTEKECNQKVADTSSTIMKAIEQIENVTTFPPRVADDDSPIVTDSCKKLSKRLKIRPTLVKLNPLKTSADCGASSKCTDPNFSNGSISPVPLDINKSHQHQTMEAENSPSAKRSDISTATNIDTLSSENHETAEKQVNNLKEKRRVHFTDDTSESDFCRVNSTVEDAIQKNLPNYNNETGNFKEETQRKASDLTDVSSQSEGENSTSQIGLVRKKTFKPNLDARRRKRLSSFSAYSSCDEDEEESRKKKRKIENSADKSSSETENNTETNNKALCEKINRSQTKKKKKKRTSGEKPVQPKLSEERDLSSLTMQELIYYRPKSFRTVELRSNKEPAADVMETIVPNVVVDKDGEKQCSIKKPQDEENIENMMAPQIMVNEDGEIVINEESLTLKKKVDDSLLKSSSVLYEDALSYGSNLRRKINRGKRWTLEETLRFYKALSQIGTDFTLMSQAFGRFSRNELKKKFKQEERVNCDLVDRALSNRLPLNMEMFLRGKQELRDFLEESRVADDDSNNNDETELLRVSDAENDVMGKIDKAVNKSTTKAQHVEDDVIG